MTRSYKFGTAENINFIELYRNYECLWNTENEYYKNRDARNAALNEFAEELGIEDFGPKEITAKIKNMRSQYLQERKKIKSSLGTGAGGKNVYVPKLSWYHSLDSFLRKPSDFLSTVSNLKPSNDESDVEESEPNNTYQEVVYLYDSDSKSTKKEVAPVRPKKLETSTPVIQKEREREREKEKEKKERDKTDGIDRRKRRRMSMFVEEETPAKENGEGDEEIEKFGKYVVCLMKTIPKELCTQLQMDMINLIMTAKIKYMAKPMETSDSNAQAEFVVMNEGKVQHMQIADDGAEKTTETDANEQTYEEVVYLQDSDTKTLKEIRLKKLDGPDKKHESEHRKRRLMTTQDEKGVDDDEIEKFGKYVTCLMKPLPNELCTQLQMDIINTIMRGKIKFMSKPTPVPQTNVIIEKVGTDYQPSLVMTVANEHMPFLEANTVVATQA
ncbi:uncharacterized protein [Epargyreus clarus]|uniref:uncharacterized protein isoform X12 n=1 Tax=Epargyreus clarus TaxID=520877 RepID=UPI003C3087DA